MERGSRIDTKPGANSSLTHYCELESPVGRLLLVGAATGIQGIDFQDSPKPTPISPDWIFDPRPLASLVRQLQEYFSGRRTTFEVELAPQGTPFQRSVWAALQTVPFGTVCSYGDLSRRIGRPQACRAVGQANRANPWPIVVPCHRVIGSDHSLTGFGGGLDIKEKLLRWETRAELFDCKSKTMV